MKIALVTEDGKTISQHFGRVPYYAVITVEDRKIVAGEQRAKSGHHTFVEQDAQLNHSHGQGHGFGQQAHQRHASMAEVIKDCEVLLTRGMGVGAYRSMQRCGIRPVVTNIADIEEAVKAVMDGAIVDYSERLH